MNLSYTLPNAEANIIAGVKLHTLREDIHERWKPGMVIHHCYSFRSKHGYSCFLKNECKGVQKVLLVLVERPKQRLHITVERTRLSRQHVLKFIANDGFTSEEAFVNWFFPVNKKGERKKTMWVGRCIHWTLLHYTNNLFIKNIK